MKHVAFDYEAQTWLEGEPARLLLIDQERKTLALLRGPSGPDYAEFIGHATGDIPLLTATIEAHLRALEEPSAVHP